MTQIRVLKRFVKNSGHPFVYTHDHTASPAESFFVRISGDLEILRTLPTKYSMRTLLHEQVRGQVLPFA